MKVDAKPLKSNISNWVSKWSYKYTEFLQIDVTTKVDDLLSFVKSALEIMDKEVPQGDFDLLIEVMGCLRDVRARTEATDAMFDPLRNTCALLKKWGVPIADNTMQGLDDCPNLWAQVKKKFFTTKERLASIQAAEAEKIKEKVLGFNSEVADFANKLQTTGPYAFSEKWQKSYELLFAFNADLNNMEAKAQCNHTRHLPCCLRCLGLFLTCCLCDYRPERDARPL